MDRSTHPRPNVRTHCLAELPNKNTAQNSLDNDEQKTKQPAPWQIVRRPNDFSEARKITASQTSATNVIPNHHPHPDNCRVQRAADMEIYYTKSSRQYKTNTQQAEATE